MKKSDKEIFPRTGAAEEPSDPVEAYRMPLMEHLRELRKRIIIVGVALIVGVVATFAWVQPIWDFLVAPMNEALLATGRGTMAMTEPLEGFMTYLKVALLSGAGLASPVIFYQLWKFVAPGLYPKEQRFILPLVFASTALFGLGAAFGYQVIFKTIFPFFLEVTSSDVEAVLSINSYLELVTKLLFAFGAAFQLPIVVFFLARAGLIDARDMIVGFRYSIVAIFVTAALLTPPDVLSQILLAGPLLVLYVIGVGVAWIFSTKEREAPEEPKKADPSTPAEG